MNPARRIMSQRARRANEMNEKAPEWKQWLVFAFVYASLLLTMAAARGCFGK